MNRSLWAITSYFNPLRYKRRLANYHAFRKFLEVPLLTVEWSPSGDFQLQQNVDADVLIQLSGGDLMWQKERLLNVALQSLPAECDLVAWLDCDIVFECSDWMVLARKELDKYMLVQLFKTVHFSPKSLTFKQISIENLAAVEPIMTGDSLAFDYATDSRRTQEIERIFRGLHDGLAWAASKKMLLKHGFYDVRIIGGGGLPLIRAACGKFEEYVRERSLKHQQTTHYLEWAIPYFETVKRSIGFVDCCIYHLWHGDMSNRQYRVRQQKLNEHDFDPYTDIVVGENGCWYWNSDKPDLHRYLKGYFAARKDDGTELEGSIL